MLHRECEGTQTHTYTHASAPQAGRHQAKHWRSKVDKGITSSACYKREGKGTHRHRHARRDTHTHTTSQPAHDSRHEKQETRGRVDKGMAWSACWIRGGVGAHTHTHTYIHAHTRTVAVRPIDRRSLLLTPSMCRAWCRGSVGVVELA